MNGNGKDCREVLGFNYCWSIQLKRAVLFSLSSFLFLLASCHF